MHDVVEPVARAAEREQRAAPLGVFLVEDSAAIRTRIASLVGSITAVKVIGEAESVAGAIDGIGRTRPDAVVLDLQIIGGSGLEVLRAVRRERPDLRVVVMTNFATDQHRRAAFDAGAASFLDKSTDFGQLREILGGWSADERPDTDNQTYGNSRSEG